MLQQETLSVNPAPPIVAREADDAKTTQPVLDPLELEWFNRCLR